jgi:hypothetical protein
MGPHGEELANNVAAEGAQAEASVAKMVFGACSSLKVLWVGDRRRAQALRDETGNLTDIVWHKEVRSAPSGWVIWKIWYLKTHSHN